MSSSSNSWNNLLILSRLMGILSQTDTVSEATLGRRQLYKPESHFMLHRLLNK